MSKINYVLAEDEDFIELFAGTYTYVGKEPYVEIPHVIQGVSIISYISMFEKYSFIRGVKSTNKNIVNAGRMFRKCKSKRLDLSEFDMTSIEIALEMFSDASIENIIWPTDKMPIHLQKISYMFCNLKTTTLDLSAFDFSEVTDSRCFIMKLQADKIIYPKEGLLSLLKADNSKSYEALTQIDAKFHTEELCWAAVLKDKRSGQYVKVKSKRILMYLGSECPEYIKFYYDKEN